MLLMRYHRPRILDLFCGGGGAGVGFFYAGFDVVGVDLNDQPFYPFEFIKADALSLDYEFLMSFDAIHASPPCQQYSTGGALARKRGKQYPDLFRPVHRMLTAAGLPYVIENVVGSPAQGIGLCGSMFGLGVRRHRIFQSNVPLTLPDTPCTCSDHHGEYITVAGSSFTKNEGALAMGIDWPIDKFQLKEAIPPAYTEHIGKQLIAHLYEHRSDSVSELPVLSVSERRANIVSEAQRVSVSYDQDICVSEYPGEIVSGNGNHPDFISETEWPLENVSNRRVVSVSERRLLPVTRRCAYCKKALPQGTARRKHCNDLCRLRKFRSKDRGTTWDK
jgi:DNA (cytosine-5)-methyltransferase 1